MNIFEQAEIDHACALVNAQIEWCDAWVRLAVFAETTTWREAIGEYCRHLAEMGYPSLDGQAERMLYSYWQMCGLPE